MVRRDRLFGDMTEAAAQDPDLPQRLYEAARNGDARTQGYWDEFGYRLAIAVSAVLHSLNCRAIVLQGGIARAMPAFMPRLEAELPKRGYPAILSSARILPCELWEEAGVIGAATLAARL
jgi:predicted NBD/HSP70 family sugar kinase